jgi:hypothetical protein
MKKYIKEMFPIILDVLPILYSLFFALRYLKTGVGPDNYELFIFILFVFNKLNYK